MTPEELELALEKIQNSINMTDDEKWNLMMKLQAMVFMERHKKAEKAEKAEVNCTTTS